MSLITDTTPLQQPDNSYPFALNVINSTKENAVAAISSEPGLTTIKELSTNYQVIGQIYFSNKILVFSTDNTTDNIGIIEDDQYTRIYTGDLNFNKDHKILGEHRILGGCEDVFYFEDGINPDRYFNLNDIPTDPSLFSMLQQVQEPELSIIINNTGGRMPSSGVSFLIQYTNLNGDVFSSSEPTISLPVYSDTINNTAQGSTEVTNKSATINITNIDTRFPYVKLVAIHNVEGQYEAYQIETLYDTNSQLTIEYQGPSDNDIRIDNREVQVDGARYNTSLVSEQVQGRLLRANVQEIVEDYSQHQRLVNSIVVLPEIVSVNKVEYSQDYEWYQKFMTFQSDEVYALGIRFTSSEKQPTPIYHIPGKAPEAGDLDQIEFNGENYLRFEIENTAEEIQRSTRGMGYYQTNTLYPTITDCEEQPIYGDLAGTPIRHHKMPSRRTVPLETPTSVNLINITLDNVTIPTGYNDYELMYVPRTNSNSTVLDSGYLNFSNLTRFPDQSNSPVRDIVGSIGSSFNDSKIGNFISPKSLSGALSRGDYFDVQKGYVRDQSTIDTETDTDNGTLISHELTLVNTVNEYFPYDEYIIIQPNSRSNILPTDVVNVSYSNVANVFNIDHDLVHQGQTYYSVNKRIASVYNNVQSLIYKPLNKVGSNYQGDTFIFNFPAFTLSNEIRQAFYLRNNYVESNLNFGLLYGDRFDSSLGTQYVANITERTDDVITGYIPEEYNINQGYNYNSIKSYFPLPLTYDYCNRCRSSNPTRIIYSPQSFQEELSDSYLISNTNDYIDIPANTGPITGLKYKNNRLYVHTTQTTYVLSPNPQYLSTNDQVAQLQTGDFLSIPPQEIIQTDYGYGGLQSKTGTLSNEYGYFWLDGLRGSLNSIQQSFKSISNNGMMNWFKNNTSTDSEVIMAFDPFYHRLITTIKNGDSCQPYHTLSYHLNSQTFTCFHDWDNEPDFYLNNSTKFYSTYNNRIKRHDVENGYNQFPHQIEQVTKNLQTQNLISLTHYTEFFLNNQEVIDTFDDVIIYNSNQSTGKINLYLGGPYDSLFYRPQQRPVRIQDKNHNVANFWDNSTNNVVTQDPCGEDTYTNKKFVNTTPEGGHYTKPIFKEKYTIARLNHKPTKDIRFTHYLLQQNKQQSIR